MIAEDEGWLRREATKALSDRRFETRVIAGGHETGGLKELAAAEGVDLIVVGSSHRGAVGRVLPGSVGERVLDNAPCAVAVAPLGLAEQSFELRQIAIGFDGSRESGVALDLATELAAEAGASLLILGAVPLDLGTTGLGGEPLDEVEIRRMRHQLQRAQGRAAGAPAVETRLVRGAPSHAIVESAEDCDLLVLGSRGHYGRLRRLFLGSVATQVMRTAPCPTVITPTA